MSRESAGIKVMLARMGHAPKWTQERLAEEAKCSPSQVSRLENGEGRPNPEVVARILRSLGLPVGAWWEEWGRTDA